MFSDSFHLFLLPYFFFAFLSAACGRDKVRVGANSQFVTTDHFVGEQIPERAGDHYGQRWSNRSCCRKRSFERRDPGALLVSASTASYLLQQSAGQ
ncbi:hypothetical protein KCP71_08835 [Salmonella enterica subsp. enterica]|nr:hypothetical protein KCP71_08835 [Salmonella enterica subsp. enterica]